MDYEEIAGVNETTQEITPSDSKRLLPHEIIFSLFVIVGLLADVAIIYTIFRFKRMCTVSNIFLANWAIADIFYLIMTPSSYRITSVIDKIPISHEFMCVLFENGFTLHVTVILFVILLTIDWFLAAYFQRASEKFRSVYKYVIGSLWIIVALFASVNIGLCINRTYYLFIDQPLLLISYVAILLIVIVLQCTRAVQKCRKKPLEYPTQMLSLATAFVISYVLAFLNILLIHATGFYAIIPMISACLIFSSSIVNFALLYRYNKDFQACFLQAIKRRGQSYEEAINENEIPTNNTNDGDKYSVQVSFHNPTEELLTNAY